MLQVIVLFIHAFITQYVQRETVIGVSNWRNTAPSPPPKTYRCLDFFIVIECLWINPLKKPREMLKNVLEMHFPLPPGLQVKVIEGNAEEN